MKESRQKYLYSILELERKYFPKHFKKKLLKEGKDSFPVGITIANESLEKIRETLKRKKV